MFSSRTKKKAAPLSKRTSRLPTSSKAPAVSSSSTDAFAGATAATSGPVTKSKSKGLKKVSKPMSKVSKAPVVALKGKGKKGFKQTKKVYASDSEDSEDSATELQSKKTISVAASAPLTDDYSGFEGEQVYRSLSGGLADPSTGSSGFGFGSGAGSGAGDDYDEFAPAPAPVQSAMLQQQQQTTKVKTTKADGKSKLTRSASGSRLIDAFGAVVGLLPVPLPPEVPFIPKDSITLTPTPIGAGSYGVVYPATMDGVKYAVKVPNPGPPDQALGLIGETFKELSTQMHAGKHENVVQLIGVSWAPPPPDVAAMLDSPLGLARLEMPHIVLEFVEGGDLLDYVKSATEDGARPLGAKEVAKLGLQAARGLGHLHDHSTIHRDISLRNMLRSRDGVVKVSDFGLARELSNPYAMAGTSARVGPLRWEAPECILSRIYSAKSDVYMFGCALYELVTGGKEPWAGLEPVAAAMRVVSGETLTSSLPEDVDPRLKKIMVECWHPVAATRPKMSEVAAMLAEIAL